jgi:acyl-CoA synthetase (NDP forming)
MMDSRSSIETLRTLFNPRTVAVVGVSKDPIKRGRQVLRNVMGGGFGGRVYGIGRGMTEADGAPCFPSLEDIPEPVDVAFLALAADTTSQTLRRCRAIGVQVAIVGAAGFAENGDPEGIARQADLQRTVRETGIRVVGPNCNGVYSATSGLALGFNAAHAVRLPRGNIAIVSHSGALFSVMAGYLNKVHGGLSFFVSCGNEADFDTLDYLEYAIDDPQTRVVALLIDSLSDGARFRHLAARAQAADKRIVVLKVGTSAIGAQAALAHSSRLTGSADAYEALFEASGVASVATIESLMTTSAMLGFHGRCAGGLGVFTTSGAGASLLADIVEKHHVPLPALQDSTQAALRPYLQFSTVGNPTDLGVFERGRSAEVPSLVAADPGLGAFMALVNPLDPNSGVVTLTQDLADAQASSRKPFVVVAPGGLTPEQTARYEADGMRVFPDTESTVAALGALLAPPRPPLRFDDDGDDIARLSDGTRTLLAGSRPLTEPESLAVLAAFGIGTVPTALCASADAMVAAAEGFGWPVVAKAVVAGVSHKTEAGFVKIDLRHADALRKAYADFGAPATVAVQPFIRGKLEAIAGMTWAQDVGMTMLAGLGGIHAEALRDVVVWSLPASRDDLRRKLSGSALGRLLASHRWHDPRSADALVDTLERLQTFARVAGPLIKAVDINPLIFTDDGVIAVDALIVPRGAA